MYIACMSSFEPFVIGIKIFKTALHHSLKAPDCLIYSGTVADTIGGVSAVEGCPLSGVPL